MPDEGQFQCYGCENISVLEMGERPAALAAWKKNKKAFDNASPVHLAEQFINMEMHSSKYVGPPISLLVLTHDGKVDWKSKGVCQ